MQGQGKWCHMQLFLGVGEAGPGDTCNSFCNPRGQSTDLLASTGDTLIKVRSYRGHTDKGTSKVSHVTVSEVRGDKGKGVTCNGFWRIALLRFVLYMDSNLYPTII